MVGVNFWHTLRANRYQVLLWGGGLALLATLLMGMVRDDGMIEQYGKIMETFPSEILSAFGADDMATLSTPDGFIAFGFFSYILIIIAVYAVNAGLEITANDEDEGMMDIVLTLPVLRRQLVIERFLAFSVITIGILLTSFIGFLVGTQFTTLKINLGGMFLGILTLIPSTLLMIVLVVLCSVIFHRKSTAMGVGVVIILVSYFIDLLAMTTTNDIIQTLSYFSFFTYSKSQYVVTDGLAIRDLLVLTVSTMTLFGTTLYLFDRRDVGL
jgi:ABC-2 type transport system permease protein